MIRNHCAVAFVGITVSDVNFKVSCFVHNNGFSFLQVWCPTVFASGHHFLLNFGLQDTVLLTPFGVHSLKLVKAAAVLA